jgi:hypothetical protein
MLILESLLLYVIFLGLTFFIKSRNKVGKKLTSYDLIICAKILKSGKGRICYCEKAIIERFCKYPCGKFEAMHQNVRIKNDF